MRILVTGGAGYIGSVVVEQLLLEGHHAIVYDNLSRGHRLSVPAHVPFVEGDLLDEPLLTGVLGKHEIDAVIHMAASSLVGESVQHPEKYYRNNVIGGLSLLNAMRSAQVSKIVFSSTAAVYGESARQPIEENDSTIPTNPYGETKLAFEKALKWHDHAYGLNYASLRYFNAAGATEGCGELHNPETHLIPIVLEVAAGRRAHIQIFGDDYPTRDGTCVRDYVHVIDLAQAHLLALRNLDQPSCIFNLGCGGDGYTVKEVIECAQKVTGREISTQTVARRAGDPAVLIASSERIKQQLGWRPRFQNLETIIESAWKWADNDRRMIPEHDRQFAV